MIRSEIGDIVYSRPMTCPFCEAVETRYLFLAKDRNQGTAGDFPVAACVNCGTWFQASFFTDDELAEHYTDRYYETSCTVRGTLLRLDIARKTLERLHHHKSPPGRLLDVGCKSGEFLKAARDSGWDVMGIELSAKASEIGQRAYDVEVVVGDFLRVTLAARSFDVVTMWHVLEHLWAPALALERAIDLLAPGGMLVIATPNPASIAARLFGPRWYHLDAPRHLALIPPRSLVGRLDEMGMMIRSLNFSVPAHNWIGIFSSLITPQRMRPGKLLYKRGDNLLQNALRHMARSPFELLAYVEAVLQRGGTYEVYAIKSS